MVRALLAATVLAVASTSAAADWRREPEGPLATDRPGNGNAATTVTRGHLQIEAGLTYAHPTGAPLHQLSLPLLLRLGVLDPLELRLGSSLLGYERAPGSRDVSPTDTSVGLKVAALHNDGPRPDLAFSADIFLPSGDGAFTAGTTVPELRALLAWSMPRDLGLLVNVGFDVPADSDDQRYARSVSVANLSYAPHPLRGRMTAFVEVFGRHGLGSDREQIVQIDWGVSGLLRDDMQLDAYLQHGVTDDAPDLQVSLGYSARL